MKAAGLITQLLEIERAIGKVDSARVRSMVFEIEETVLEIEQQMIEISLRMRVFVSKWSSASELLPPPTFRSPGLLLNILSIETPPRGMNGVQENGLEAVPAVQHRQPLAGRLRAAVKL
jgi:hypothetical protein